MIKKNSMNMKRLLCLLLACSLLSATLLVGCTHKPPQPIETTETVETEEPRPLEVLASPTGLAISEAGVITWNAVEQATSYVVNIGGQEYTTDTTSFVAPSTEHDFNFFVCAMAEGYITSEPSETKTYQAVYVPPVILPTIAVAIKGRSEIRPGKSVTLSAQVTGTEEQTVIWSVAKGEQYATIDAVTGKLVATEDMDLEGDGIIEVRATSLVDESCYASKIIHLLRAPDLTQAMLDEIATQDKLGFEGFVNISLYTIGLNETFYLSTSTTVKTALDGTNWFAEYTNGELGIVSSLYFKHHGDEACQVGVSFMNEEQYAPMLDDDGNPVSWEAAGLYNNFIGLKVEDFTFDPEMWRWVYTGDDESLPQRMVAAANPYDFVAKNLALIIEEGEIIGIFSQSEDDYGIVSGYRGEQELTVAINYGQTVEVPTVTRYQTDENGKHEKLSEAIANMQSLSSYSLSFRETTASYLTTGYSVSGFEEIITPDNCYFTPYTVKYNTRGEEQRTYGKETYGFKKISEELYNAYAMGEDGSFTPHRAYAKDFSAARPSFAFAAEIFNSYYEDTKENTLTFYVDKPMSGVASTFYYGMGNDIALYGIFATEGYISTGNNGALTSFTPFVTVKDGYIIEAGFYFYMGSIYGMVDIEYSDFQTAALPEELECEFIPRQVPSSWEELEIIVTGIGDSTSDDQPKPAPEVMQEFFGVEGIDKQIPFFGEVLGDTYGFGMTTVRVHQSGTNQTIVFYYDVPLDTDYTITSSMNAVREYLLGLGFKRNAQNEYRKDGLVIEPVDSSLDFTIYVWRESVTP